MFIETDLAGVSVLVVGVPGETEAVVRRFVRAGAAVVTAPDPAAVTEATRPIQLAVVVGAAGSWPEARALRSRCLVVEEEVLARERGRIVLVGAGPGGPGLLTLDAVAALAEADVVLTDRLASVGDLARFAPGAEVIDVGKGPGHHPVAQHEIQALMVERATRGLTVVRLKGGDPFVYGRGSEEIEAARAAGIPVSVVAGVTSAVAVPGAAGIPVTQRDVSHVVTVISGHLPLSRAHAESLVNLGGTIVVLMGVHNLVPLTSALLAAGHHPDTPAAVVERGLTPDMRSLFAPLRTLAEVAIRNAARSPAVIVIGEVVRQSEGWRSHADTPERAPRPRTGAAPRAQRHTTSAARPSEART